MKSEFRTADLALSAFLRISGFELLSVSPVGRRKSEFVFRDTDGRQELVMRFFNHRGKVDPLEYMNTLKSLKALATGAQPNEMKGTANDVERFK